MQSTQAKLPAPRSPRTHVPKYCVGMSSAFEFTIRFIRWAESHRTPVTYLAIQMKWNVSTATAFRWLAAWRAAQETVDADRSRA